MHVNYCENGRVRCGVHRNKHFEKKHKKKPNTRKNVFGIVSGAVSCPVCSFLVPLRFFVLLTVKLRWPASTIRFCGMCSMPSTHPMRKFTSLTGFVLSCVNMEGLLHDWARASFVWPSKLSMRISWKLGTNKRVPTRKLATSLSTLSASSVNLPAGQVENCR